MKHTTSLIQDAKKGALEVLRYCRKGPCEGLPRTAGFGYPEPYTRDLMISSLGVLVSGDEDLIDTLRFTLETLAGNLSPLGQVPSYIHQPGNLGASDTTPLFLLATALYRKATGEHDFLASAVEQAHSWMRYQSPDEGALVPQQPTTDWRDEQWVSGFGLFVNSIIYTYNKFFQDHGSATQIKEFMNQYAAHGKYAGQNRKVRGFSLDRLPYYALWTFKMYCSDRLDLPGNSLAILSGIASRSRAEAIITWVERECREMQKRGELVMDLPPNLVPIIERQDPDWLPRYEVCNKPGDYHNGGIWPFTCGLYIAALVAAGKHSLAEKKLAALAQLAQPARKRLTKKENPFGHSREEHLEFGFNEWFTARDGVPRGANWQYWSAAMYLYAAACVEEKRTPFFEEIREW